MPAHTKGFFSRNWNKVTRRYRYVNQTANFTIPHAAGKRMTGIYLAERNGAAITGGVRIGTAAGGAQILAATAVAANSLTYAVPLLNGALSLAAQTLYIEAVTAWNGAQLDVVIEYEEVPFN